VLEPLTLRGADHVISVSPAYPEVLRTRYPFLRHDQFTVLPFGAPEHDFAVLPSLGGGQRVFDPNDGYEHWLYVGVCGDVMRRSLEALFQALYRARQCDPARFERVRLHFVGTAYAEAGRGRKSVEPVAQACGVSDLVDERVERIPYFEALHCLRDADVLLVVGSDDPGYTASKLYPYILARKPLLAIFHERSSVIDVLRRTRAGTAVSFASDDPTGAVADRVYDAAFAKPMAVPDTDWAAFAQYTAREMAARQCEVFDRVLTRRTAA
jgi:hypothetical protein